MVFINLTNIEDNLLEFALAKDDFEKMWMKKNVISDKMKIADFISCINLQHAVLYIKRLDEYVPVSYMVSEKDEYIFYCTNNSLNNDDKQFLESTKYLDNINAIQITDLVAAGLTKPSNDHYYVIDGQFYILNT